MPGRRPKPIACASSPTRTWPRSTRGSTARRLEIHLERERRATAVREDLAASLAEHGSKIDKEIEGIDAAIATYRAEVSAYFENLDRETDPILIAQKAALRPAFPALDAVGGAVAAEAPADTDTAVVEPASADEPEVVGVMDPAAPAEPVESWAAAPEAISTPDPVEILRRCRSGRRGHPSR